MIDQNEYLARAQMAGALRELAAFLERNLNLPLPNSCELLYSVMEDDDETERREVDRIAAILEVTPSEANGGAHYMAVRSWGPISYRAVAIAEEEMERYRAGLTYIDVVKPEIWPI